MYDNIYLQNRIGMNGKIKKKDLTVFDYGLQAGLWIALIMAVVGYLFIFLNNTDFKFTIDLFFENLIANKTLQILAIFIGVVGVLLYYCFSKAKHSVAFQVNTETNVLSIVFNEGKHIGLEYHLLLDEISNVCMYKNHTYSFYCNYIEIDKKGKISDMKGTIKFCGGDSQIFVSDLVDYTGKRLKFVNKKD